jgi:hypothetical protein
MLAPSVAILNVQQGIEAVSNRAITRIDFTALRLMLDGL